MILAHGRYRTGKSNPDPRPTDMNRRTELDPVQEKQEPEPRWKNPVWPGFDNEYHWQDENV